METDFRARELALEGATLVFLAIAAVGLLAGAESHVAILKAAVAGVVVAVAGRLPLRILLAAMARPAEDEETEGQAAPAEAPAATRSAQRRAA